MKLFTCWDSPCLHFAGQGKRFKIKEVPDGRDAGQIKKYRQSGRSGEAKDRTTFRSSSILIPVQTDLRYPASLCK